MELDGPSGRITGRLGYTCRLTDFRIQGAGLTEVFQGGKPRFTWRAAAFVGPQSAALDRVFVFHPDLPPLDMTVLWNKVQ